MAPPIGSKIIRWTEEEKQLLIQSYQKFIYIDKQEIRKLFPTRSWGAIMHAAIKLHLTEPLKKWSQQETQLLTKIWGVKSRKYILEKFIPYGRTWYAIREHARTLQIVRDYNTALDIVDKITLSNIDAAYIAGFIDGEGSILITRRNSPHFRGYSPMVTISNTDKEVLIWIQSRIGGNLFLDKYGRRPHWKIQYQLKFWKILHIKQILPLLLPYLKVKKRKAIIVLQYCNERAKKGNRFYSGKEKKIYNDLYYNKVEPIG